MKEQKHEQEMRERRNQECEHWHDGNHGEHFTVSYMTIESHFYMLFGALICL